MEVGRQLVIAEKHEVHVVGEWQIVDPVFRQALPSGLRRLPHEPPIDHGETVG